MRRKRREREEPAIEVSMTPMIDVVFQLLIYFLVTFSTPDVLAQLDISRPAPDTARPEPRTPPKMIRISVDAAESAESGYRLNGRAVSRSELSALLQKLAQISSNQTVLIRCAADSEHARLVGVLDLCAAGGLSNLSVVSAE
jgi:biopolymer transport protein ExbD